MKSSLQTSVRGVPGGGTTACGSGPVAVPEDASASLSPAATRARRDDPDRPSIAVPVSGNVYCPTDLTRDFEVDFGDFLAFFNCYDVAEGPGSECADLDGNPGVDFGDFLTFFNGYDAGC